MQNFEIHTGSVGPIPGLPFRHCPSHFKIEVDGRSGQSLSRTHPDPVPQDSGVEAILLPKVSIQPPSGMELSNL